jgi:hypothetical protein
MRGRRYYFRFQAQEGAEIGSGKTDAYKFTGLR